MKIALAHFRVDETDGVSLEMEKWKIALEKSGHEIVYISGSKVENQIYIPELYYKHPLNIRIFKNAYQGLRDFETEDDFNNTIMEYAVDIETELLKKLRSHNVDLLIVNNIWSLGWNLSAGIAFSRAAAKLNIPAIGHHHDFYWEREKYSKPSCDFVKGILQEYFPPDNLVHQVVINDIARRNLLERKGLEAMVIPNVFDFCQEVWLKDEYNKDLKQGLGLAENDIVLLQATRVTERKAIELAVEMTASLNKRRQELSGVLYNGQRFTNDSRIVLVLAGLPEADRNYINFLQELADDCGVELLWVNDLIKAERVVENNKYYSLWDIYTIADIITYPSILEGWGNQFLEAIFSRTPVALFEYPVFADEIKEKGFLYASFGSEYEMRDNGYVRVPDENISRVTDKVMRYLKDKEYRNDVVETNFRLGKEFYSYQVLGEELDKLLNDI